MCRTFAECLYCAPSSMQWFMMLVFHSPTEPLGEGGAPPTTHTYKALRHPFCPSTTDDRALAGQQKAIPAFSPTPNVPKLPSYMNPGAMNPVKFQEIQEKRKLLWGGKKKEVLGKRGVGTKKLRSRCWGGVVWGRECFMGEEQVRTLVAYQWFP